MSDDAAISAIRALTHELFMLRETFTQYVYATQPDLRPEVSNQTTYVVPSIFRTRRVTDGVPSDPPTKEA